MDEKYFKDKISGYFDGDLKPEEMEMMTEWLKNSAEGQEALAKLGRLDEFVRDHNELSGSEDFWEKQAQKIEARLGFETVLESNVTDILPKESSGLGWKMIAAAASVVLLIYVGVNRDDIFGPEKILSSNTVKLDSPAPVVPAPDEKNLTGQDQAVSEPENAKLRQDSDERGDDDLSGGIGAKDSSLAAAPAPISPPPSPSVQREQRAGRSSVPASTERRAESTTLADEPDRAVGEAEEEKKETLQFDGMSEVTGEPQQRRLEASRAPELFDSFAEALVADSMLGVWRQMYSRTDSALTDLAGTKPDVQMPELTNSLSRKAAPAAADRPVLERTVLEADLLEACFHIAETTPDSAERTAMRDRLTTVAADSKSANQQRARDYLSRLDSLK